MMTTEDREALYQQAWNMCENGLFGSEMAVCRTIVDLVLDAHPTERQPWEVLREAEELLDAARTIDPDGAAALACRHLAHHLHSEHLAVQEKAAAEAEREKLIEQAAKAIFDTTVGEAWDLISETRRGYYRNAARKVRDMLDAPTTDGGEA